MRSVRLHPRSRLLSSPSALLGKMSELGLTPDETIDIMYEWFCFVHSLSTDLRYQVHRISRQAILSSPPWVSRCSCLQTCSMSYNCSSTGFLRYYLDLFSRSPKCLAEKIRYRNDSISIYQIWHTSQYTLGRTQWPQYLSYGCCKSSFLLSKCNL